jgi:hypothetical protein
MARGWESKSVESQIDAQEARRPKGPQPTLEQIAKQRESDALQLQRTRILHDLAKATNPRYRQTLNAALAHLDRRIEQLKT